MTGSDDSAALIRALHDEVLRRLPDVAPNALSSFLHALYDHFPLEDIAGRDLADLAGSAIGSWQFLQQLAPGQAKVRVFNPDYERHGWQQRHTVVAALCRDMPFALESLRAEINRRNWVIHVVHGARLHGRRDAGGHLREVLSPAAEEGQAELLLYFEIARRSDPEQLAELRGTLQDILREVQVVTGDFDAMQQRAQQAMADLDMPPGKSAGDVEESRAFVRWMLEGHFTYLGYEYLRVDDSGNGPGVHRDAGLSLGLLRLRSSSGETELGHDLERHAREQWPRRQLHFSKSSVRSRVHRRVYPDYVGLWVFDDAGRVVAEHRFLGMYTSRAYTASPLTIPLLRRKVDAVMRRSGLSPSGHEWSALMRVLETHPRDELFLADSDELFTTATAINRIQERRQIRLFLRRDPHGKFVSCLVFMPRDLYQTELRRRIQERLCQACGATESEFITFFSESVLTRTQFILRIDPAQPWPLDTHALERDIADLAMAWQDHLHRHLLEEFGDEQGALLMERFGDCFPPGYRADCDPRAAVSDIRNILTLAQDGDIAMGLYRLPGEAHNTLRFRLYRLCSPLVLSDVMPILENLGLRVVGERPYELCGSDGRRVWIHDFSLVYGLADHLELVEVGDIFQQAFAAIWGGEAESDSFNKLVLGAQLGWRRVALLRALGRYLRQLQFPFSLDFLAETLARHLPLTRQIVHLFELRFDPDLGSDEEARERAVRDRVQAIGEALESVENLSEDRVIRQFMVLIQALVRCNVYQCDEQGRPRPWFSFKFRTQDIPEAPEPRPLYEIFVYSPQVEGVHLRAAPVARGGLRWSDRLEDYRTEVLGLMKAQQVKNAVIVPAGAKGGFVARQTPAGGREQALEHGIACYRSFISGLLDVTDNLVEGRVQRPPRVVCHDDDDPYLVVAADKGTASFSDIANGIAEARGFWLGDAFASGGSNGYDHKKMGITARGAWVSVQRHFREQGVDVQREAITVVGIGDMSGDVFGNGMLRSRHIRLVAAFNHQHIFIDPEPDAERSHQERERLFALPRSGWDDYDPALISEGGGVFRRSAKSIAISPQMRRRFGIAAERLAPNELVSALLRAEVDLLWNGGIGTYVKASHQGHADCGDKANDPVRVDARELRCRVIGEGGNLGLTQAARVEYSLHGGRCNTDFIDNAGGVDCSDHEVNIKILLNAVVAAGDMTEKQRRQLLEAMTDSVAALVLRNNARQTLAISLAERDAVARMGEYRRLIRAMEGRGLLRRDLEQLPDDEALVERRAAGKGLTRPELAVLFSHAKTELKSALVDAGAGDDPYLARAVFEAFPQRLHGPCAEAIGRHRLRREIVATQVANDMVDHMGISFVERMMQSTGAGLAEIARAYVAARDVFEMPRLWQAIEALDAQVPAALQMEMMAVLMRLVRRCARWFIRNRRTNLDVAAEVAQLRPAVAQLRQHWLRLIDGSWAEEMNEQRLRYRESGVPGALVDEVAAAGMIYPLLGILDAAHVLRAPPRQVSEVYYALARELELDWFARQVMELKVDNHWQALARESFRDDLEWQLRRLTEGAYHYLEEQGDVAACVGQWLQNQQSLVQRWRGMLTELHAASAPDLAMCAVAIRELLDLAQSTRLERAEVCDGADPG